MQADQGDTKEEDKKMSTERESAEACEGSDRRASQDALIQAALARGSSYREAGEQAGVSARTVRRRMSDEPFAREVSVMRGERVGEITGRLVELSAASITALANSLEDPDPSIRLKAIALILSHAARLRRDHDVELRLLAMEAKLERSEKAPGDEKDAQ